MNKMKLIKTILLVILILTLLCVAVFAATGMYRNIRVLVSDISISLNGKPVQVHGEDIFQYNDVLYVPIDIITEISDLSVEIDSAGNANVYNKTPIRTGEGTSDNPYEVNQPGYVTIESAFDGPPVKFEVVIIESIRGKYANFLMCTENMYNIMPEDGYEWLLLHVSAEHVNGPVVSIGESFFDYCYIDGTKVEKISYSIGKNLAPFYGEGSIDGWIPVMVKIDHKILLSQSCYDYITHEFNYVWFSIQ
jgi:hypothetical protein